jgi:multidrug efflux pump subunit AcrA (membrane-fusion protein)
MKKWFIWFFIVVLLATGSYFGYDYLKQKNNSATSSDILAEEIDLDAAVEVKKGTIRETVSTSGYISPENEIYLTFSSTGTTGGTVEEIFVEVGTIVKEGDKLVKLEDKQERLNYLRAKNEYELAKISGSPSQIEEKKLAMEVAFDNYESKTLKAPFAGKVVDIFVEEGDYVEGYDNVVYLIDDSSYEVKVSISEVDCLKVEVGQKVEIELDILKGRIFTGKVTEVAEYARAESGVVTVPVTIKMDEVSPIFKPQFSATAEIIVNSAENVLTVPVTAISQNNDKSIVLKVEDKKAIPTPVKTGISDGYYQEIIEGLEAGDKIIVNNYHLNSGLGSSERRFGGPGMPMMRP